jgi:hypothetical protein
MEFSRCRAYLSNSDIRWKKTVQSHVNSIQVFVIKWCNKMCNLQSQQDIKFQSNGCHLKVEIAQTEQGRTWPQAWTPASVLLAPTNWRSFLWSFVLWIKAFSNAHCTVGGDSWYCQPENIISIQNNWKTERIQLFI